MINKLKGTIMIALLLTLVLGIPTYALLNPPPAPQPTRIEISRSKTAVIAGGINMGGRGADLAAVQDFIENQIANNPDQQSVDIFIDSPGGAFTPTTEVFLAYLDYLHNSQKIEVRCIVGNVSASLATVILSHCSQRYAFPRSQIMFHGARIGGLMRMNQYEAQDIANMLAQLDDEIWAPMRALINDEAYWDKNFRAERLIPALELASKYDFVTIIESVELTP